MNKVIKWILIGVGALVALVVVAVIVLTLVINPNDYRDEISNMAYKATGRNITLGGDLGLKIFPRIAITVKDVTVAQDEGFGDAPLAHVDELGLKMALFPLLRGRVEVDAITVDGLNAALVTDANGRNNWEVSSHPAAGNESAPQGDSANTPAADEVKPTADAEEVHQRLDQLLKSRIDAVDLTNCTVSYDNRATKQNYLAQINSLSLKDVGINRDIKIALDALAQMGAATKATLNLDGNARYDYQQRQATFNFGSFALGAEAPQLQSRQEIKGKLAGMYNGSTSEAKLNADLNSAFMTGKADLDLGNAAANGNVDLKANLLTLVQALSPEVRNSMNLPPELLASNSPLRSLDLKLVFNTADKVLNVSTAEMRLGGNELVASIPSMQGRLNAEGGLESAQGSVSIKGDLRPLLPLAGFSPKGDAFSKLDGSMNFNLSGDNLTLSALKMTVDDTLAQINSNQAVIRLKPSGPLLLINSVRADLNVNAKPRQLMDGFGIDVDTADPQALAQFQAGMNLAVDNTSMRVSDLKGQLDQTSITAALEALLPGSKGIPRGATSSYKANLQLGAINLDRYLPEDDGADAKSGAADANKGAAASKPPLKGTAFEKAHAELNAGIQSLTVKKVPIQNVTLACVLDNGVLTVSRAALRAFDGQLNASAKADLVREQGQGSLNASLTGLNIGSALSTLFDEKRLTGQANMNADFTFKGLTENSILTTLNGKGSVRVTNGVITGFHLIPDNAPSILLKHRLNDYHFNDLGGTFTVVNGKLINNDLGYTDKNFSVTGQGSITLVNRNVDYNAVLKNKEIGEVPVRIQGPINALHVTLDQDALLKGAANKVAGEALKELQNNGIIPEGLIPQGGSSSDRRQQINEKVGDQLQRGLENLIKR